MRAPLHETCSSSRTFPISQTHLVSTTHLMTIPGTVMILHACLEDRCCMIKECDGPNLDAPRFISPVLKWRQRTECQWRHVALWRVTKIVPRNNASLMPALVGASIVVASSTRRLCHPKFLVQCLASLLRSLISRTRDSLLFAQFILSSRHHVGSTQIT
jgi:hypothetical protein